MPYYYEQTPGYPAPLTPDYGAYSYSLADLYDPAFGLYDYSRSGLTPGYGSGLTPGYRSGLTPAYGSGMTPGYGRGRTPGYGSGRTPGYGSLRTPGYGASMTTGYGTGRRPGYHSGGTPGYGTGMTPGTDLRTPASRTRKETEQAIDRLTLQRDSLARQLRARMAQEYPIYDPASFDRDMKRHEEDLVHDRNERPERPRMNSQREPSYFRSFPGRAGQTPAAVHEERTPGNGMKLKLPADAVKNADKEPLGAPAKASPGPSKLRGSVTFEDTLAADDETKEKSRATRIQSLTFEIADLYLSQVTAEGKGKMPASDDPRGIVERALDWTVLQLRFSAVPEEKDGSALAEPVVAPKAEEVVKDSDKPYSTMEELSDGNVTADSFGGPED